MKMLIDQKFPAGIYLFRLNNKYYNGAIADFEQVHATGISL